MYQIYDVMFRIKSCQSLGLYALLMLSVHCYLKPHVHVTWPQLFKSWISTGSINHYPLDKYYEN